MDHSGATLLLARAFHLNQADGPNIDAGFRFVFAGCLFQKLAMLYGCKQRVLPTRAGAVTDVQIKLDHLLGE